MQVSEVWRRATASSAPSPRAAPLDPSCVPSCGRGLPSPWENSSPPLELGLCVLEDRPLRGTGLWLGVALPSLPPACWCRCTTRAWARGEGPSLSLGPSPYKDWEAFGGQHPKRGLKILCLAREQASGNLIQGRKKSLGVWKQRLSSNKGTGADLLVQEF